MISRGFIIRRAIALAVTTCLLMAALILAVSAGAVIGARNPKVVLERLPVPLGAPRPPEVEDTGTFGVFWEAWQTVHDEYLDPSALEEQRLTYGAIRGMVQSLGDPNTAFQTPPERQLEMSAYTGHFEGIGAYIDARDGRLAIVAPIEGTPAERAGLEPGDVVLAVDGEPVAGWSAQQAALRIRGPKGTSVTLTLLRAGAAPFQVSIERDEVALISARGRMVEPEIALLRLTSFTTRTNSESNAVLDSLSREGARALVVDLRGNPGGLLEPAVEVASRLVPDGPIVWQENARGERYAYQRRNEHSAVTWPLAVLVDRGTASAAEVMAAAVRDSGKGPLIGQRTYGKGTVQYLHELSDGAGLRVTAAHWISPGGTYLNQEGLVPDLPIDTPRTESTDSALELAVQHLRRVMSEE